MLQQEKRHFWQQEYPACEPEACRLRPRKGCTRPPKKEEKPPNSQMESNGQGKEVMIFFSILHLWPMFIASLSLLGFHTFHVPPMPPASCPHWVAHQSWAQRSQREGGRLRLEISWRFHAKLNKENVTSCGTRLTRSLEHLGAYACQLRSCQGLKSFQYFHSSASLGHIPAFQV